MTHKTQKKPLKTLKKNLMTLIKAPLFYRLLGGAFLLFSANGAYSDAGQEIEAQVTTIMGIIFSKPIRLIVMLFGISWGFLKSVLGGSFQPLIMYGGIGLFFFFIPKLIMLIASIGG